MDGARFIRMIITLLGVTIALYAISHLLVVSGSPTVGSECDAEACADDCTATDAGQITWRTFVCLDALGTPQFFNLADIDWYVGIDRAEPVITDLQQRAAQMSEMRTRIRAGLEVFRSSLTTDGRNAVDSIIENLSRGEYEAAYVALTVLIQTAGEDDVRDAEIQRHRDSILELQRMREAQRNDAVQLAPPLSRLFFWTSPSLSIVEVLFWALFGVLTNLLVNAAEYLRKDNFNPNEVWVAYTKLVYGPVLATVLVLALINGWFSVESYDIRVWSLPLVAFLFGYAARRTARLVDVVLARFLGQAEQGARAGPGAVAAERERNFALLRELTRPRSFKDFRDQAKKLARETVAIEAAKLEGSQ
jgi:hypothetical protein